LSIKERWKVLSTYAFFIKYIYEYIPLSGPAVADKYILAGKAGPTYEY
jgi:hypothetical protein